MGKKIFITYKYGDTGVRSLNNVFPTRARDYVDELQKKIGAGDHINKGELDGESLEDFEDDTIASKLRNKIYDSSITIILISKNMKAPFAKQSDQWMPWEISYSLKEHTRDGRTSLSNALLAVVLPDEYGSYGYFLTSNPFCNSTNYNTDFLFDIMKKNMFNIKKEKATTRECNGNTIYEGYFSYIHTVTWDHFIDAIDAHLEIALSINRNIDSYHITKSI